jgi:hypothetical protein
VDIHQDQIRFVLGKSLQKVVTRGDDLDCVAFPLDDGLRQSSRRYIVLDVQNIGKGLGISVTHGP